ncbi:MAG: hypothetical protein AAFQ80_02325 [Cyanobacteria bacterium J06621_8]
MPKLNHSAIKARNNLLAMFIVLTVLDIALVVAARDLWAVGRIIFTVAVMYFVMRGYKWAKWLLVAILSLVIVLLIGLLAALHSQLSTFLIIGSIVMIILSVIMGIFLTSNSDLQRYLADQRQIIGNDK